MVLPSSGPGQISSRPKHELLGPPNGGEKYRGNGTPKNQGNGGVGEIVFHLARNQVLILLMEEILHHLECIKPCK